MKPNCNQDSLKDYDPSRVNFKLKTTDMFINISKAFVILLLLFSNNIYSQERSNNLKCWMELRVSYKVVPKLNVKLNQLFAFNNYPFGYSFSQTELSLSYKLRRRTYIEGGFARGSFIDSKSLRRQGASDDVLNTVSVYRIFAEFSYKHNIDKRLTLRHKIEVQYFLLDLKKYKTRYIYSAKFSYNIKRSSLAPYLESLFYYYQGGIISNGIKRIRLKPGLSFKPIKGSSLKISVYLLFQNEFNTEQLSDNDYTVFGTTISFKIK